MATSTWVSITGNMNSAASYSPSGIPAPGDTVVFSPGKSAISPSTGMNFLSTGALKEIVIEPGWNLPIGSSSNPWKCESNFIRHYGDATLFYSSDPVGGGGLQNTGFVLIETKWKGPALVLTPNPVSDIVTLVVRDGYVISAGSAFLNSLVVGGLPGSSPILELQTGTSTFATAILYGGTVRCGMSALSSATTTGLYIHGGTWYQSSGSLSYVKMVGGSLIYDSTSAILDMQLGGGILDTSRTSHVRTITNMVQYGRSEFIRSPQTTVTAYRDLRRSR